MNEYRLESGHTLDEVQVLRDEILAVIHDEHTADVELDVVALLLGLEEVKRRTLGHEEDGLELELTLDREVLDGEMLLPIVAQALVERGVLLGGNFLKKTSATEIVDDKDESLPEGCESRAASSC
jgi:hypothetical protein